MPLSFHLCSFSGYVRQEYKNKPQKSIDKLMARDLNPNSEQKTVKYGSNLHTSPDLFLLFQAKQSPIVHSLLIIYTYKNVFCNQIPYRCHPGFFSSFIWSKFGLNSIPRFTLRLDNPWLFGIRFIYCPILLQRIMMTKLAVSTSIPVNHYGLIIP